MNELVDINPEKTAKNNKIGLVVLCLIIFGVLFYAYLKGKSLTRHAKYVSGMVSTLETGHKSHASFGYTYLIDGKLYKRSNYLYFKHYDDISILLGKQFTVMYDSTDYTNAVMLIFPQEFERWGLPFPDSLNWLKPYLE